MQEIKYPVMCPLMNAEKISMDTCFDIHMVVEGNTPRWTAPEQIYEIPHFEEVCRRCKYHRD